MTQLEFTEALKHPYAWPGGYAIHFLMADGQVMCHRCAVAEQETVLEDWETYGGSWAVEGTFVHWEGPPEICCHCNEEIPSEYGDPDESEEG